MPRSFQSVMTNGGVMIDLLPTFVFWYLICFIPAVIIMGVSGAINIESVQWAIEKRKLINIPERPKLITRLIITINLIIYPVTAIRVIKASFNAEDHIDKLAKKYGYK